ncbi:beta-1,3-glucosyltransferase-like [Physella acuta]|uniref:beta-1,3-glucosyltransferase-like n=1 Tax=Physella acuta TaxID=109671 RepID=UPI0027DADE80|nr:beta-1,3-glucosyltransferase-like [Physella acuta]
MMKIHFGLAACIIVIHIGCLHAESRHSTEKTVNHLYDAKSILFIVLSQPNEYHVSQAKLFRQQFVDQLTQLDKADWPQLIFTHEDFVDVHGSWTVIPLLGKLVEKLKKSNTSWVFICEEDTQVDIGGLSSLLQQYDPSQEYFLGRELRDQQTTIIHHFAFADDPSKFTYPDFRAGFVLSRALVVSLFKRFKKGKFKADFSIDPKHELSMFIWDNGVGTTLTNIKEFCSADKSSGSHCVTRQPQKFPECGVPLKKQDLVVAVKTCQQFHETRVPIVQATWGKQAGVIEYFSDVKDSRIPTTDLGIPNTERGHCGKTIGIIRRIVDTTALSSPAWVLIADDDTIINLDRLRALLACYNHRQPVALGERYGYSVVQGGGYDYITGGGGMVFSQPAIRLLSTRCNCYADDSPDDMTLGMCLKSIGVPVTHSRFFHQARPDDYSKDFLSNQLPVSFHKHWNNDPYKVFADLTADHTDNKVKVMKKKHTEEL